MKYTENELADILVNVKSWMQTAPTEGIMFLQKYVGMPVKDPGDPSWTIKVPDVNDNLVTVASFSNPFDAEDMLRCNHYTNAELWHKGEKVNVKTAQAYSPFWE